MWLLKESSACCVWCVEQEKGSGFVRSVGDRLVASILRNVVKKDMGRKADLGRWIKWKQRGGDEEKRIKFFSGILG